MWFGLFHFDNKLDINIVNGNATEKYSEQLDIGNNYRYVAYNALLRKNRK